MTRSKKWILSLIVIIIVIFVILINFTLLNDRKVTKGEHTITMAESALHELGYQLNDAESDPSVYQKETDATTYELRQYSDNVSLYGVTNIEEMDDAKISMLYIMMNKESYYSINLQIGKNQIESYTLLFPEEKLSELSEVNKLYSSSLNYLNEYFEQFQEEVERIEEVNFNIGKPDQYSISYDMIIDDYFSEPSLIESVPQLIEGTRISGKMLYQGAVITTIQGKVDSIEVPTNSTNIYMYNHRESGSCGVQYAEVEDEIIQTASSYGNECFGSFEYISENWIIDEFEETLKTVEEFKDRVMISEGLEGEI